MQNVNRMAEAELGLSVLQLRALVDALPAMVCAGSTNGSGLDFVSQPFPDYTGLERP